MTVVGGAADGGAATRPSAGRPTAGQPRLGPAGRPIGCPGLRQPARQGGPAARPPAGPADSGGPAVSWEPDEGYGAPAGDRWRSLALASLLLGVAALLLSFVFVVGVAALVTGLVARARSRARGAGRQALATTGAVLGAISLLLGGAIVGLLVHVDQTDRTFTTLRAGDCVDPVGGLLAHYTLTGCDKPHHYETYGVVTALDPSGSPWPGDFGFGLDATQCTPLVLQYVDGPLDRSRFQTVVLLPTEADWDRGVRRLVCVVEGVRAERLVGTVRSSGAAGSSGGTT